MKTIRLTVVLLLSAALAAECRAQFGRPPVPVPHVPIPHVPIHVGGRDTDAMPWILGGLGVVGAIVGIGYVAQQRKRRSGAAGRVRIIATPPGDAPESIRRAWVGVELPLLGGEKQPQALSVQGVLSRAAAGSTVGYVVDGRTAVSLLASHDPNAADWWRQNAPHVLAGGYQLIFPANVCEPLGPGPV